MLPVLLLTALAAVAPLTPLRVVHPFQDVGRYDAGNRGVDLAGFPGQVVVSSTGGVVRFAGPVAGVGVVSVDLGDGRRLTYEPVSPAVRTGEVVQTGEPIGRLDAGRAGCPAPACLHWGLVSGGGVTLAYADPLALLGPRQVRLLPLAGSPARAAGPMPQVSAGPAPAPGTALAPAPAPRAARQDTAGAVSPVAAERRTGPSAAAAVGGAVGTAALGAALGVVATRRRAGPRRRGPAIMGG